MSIAFFDIDGTLLAKPSLERRLFQELQLRGEIPLKNYAGWLAEFLRLALKDATTAMHASKSYLSGVSRQVPSASTLPEFFPAAIQRLWWHAVRGDVLVLVSGTLAPLAEVVKFVLERELLWRGIETEIQVRATDLEVQDGRWTGRVQGAAMFGAVKCETVREFARSRGVPLTHCSAYGDSSLDRWMLAAVGHPFAVNPTRRLRRMAHLNGWSILHWTHCPLRTASEQRHLNETSKQILKWTP